MPLFGNAGRQAAPAPPSPAAAPRGPSLDPVPAQAERLGQQLREIAAGTVAPEEAFEPALRAILASTSCAAGALCLYDQRHEMLRLAAEVGLSDEGCKHLRSVGGGSTWDMPLHSLLNRRAYLIDSAAQNRYVPPLVEGTAQTIACIPLHSGVTPLGSLVLITIRPRVLGERDIRMVDRPLRELVKMIEMIRRRGPGTPAETPRAVPAATPPPAPAEVAPPAPVPAPAAPAPDAGLPERLAETETALAEERRAKAELEDAVARERSQREGAEAAREVAVRASVTAAAQVAEAREQVRSTEDQLLAAREQLAAVREQARAAEDARAAAAATVGALQADEGLRERLAETETALAEERRARAELEAAVARERGQREEAEAVRDAAERAAVTVTEQVAEAREQARSAEERLLAAQEQARTAEEARAAADASAGALHAAIAETATETRGLQNRLAEIEGELARACTERDEVRRALDAAGAEREAAAAAFEAARADHDALLASLEASHAECVALRAVVEATRAERDAAVALAPDAAPDPVAPPPSPPPLPVAEPVAEPVDEPVVEVAVISIDSTPVLSVADCVPVVVVLDAGSGWGTLAFEGKHILTVAPDAQVEQSVVGVVPMAVVVNLAAAGALAALRTLRTAGVRAPAFACIAAPGMDRALSLGVLEVVFRPVDTDVVVTAVARAASGSGRLVSVSEDVEALMSVRQALTRKGTSVSMAWDAKQALDLLSMLRPDVVLVDLELGRSACGVVGALVGLDPAPALMLIAADGDQAEGFAALARVPQSAERLLPLKGVMAGVIGWCEAARPAS